MLAIKTGAELNKNPKYKYIWMACPNCGRGRWVIFLSTTKSGIGVCKSCCNKGAPHPAWNKGLTSKTDSRIVGKPVSEEQKQRQRLAMLGHPVSDEVRNILSIKAKNRAEEKYKIKDPNEVIRLYQDEKLSINKISQILNYSSDRIRKLLQEKGIEIRTRSEEISLALRRSWIALSSDKRNFLINRFIESGKRSNKLPNKSEIILKEIIEKIIPDEYLYTGWQTPGKTVMIGGLRPDFFNINNQKKVIELFGTRFHPVELSREDTENTRKRIYNNFGFDCLVIWEDELKNPTGVITKLLQFVKL